MFVVIADEEIECWSGTIHKGDVLETNMHEDLNEFLKYLNNQYGPRGQDIKVKWRKVEWNSLHNE